MSWRAQVTIVDLNGVGQTLTLGSFTTDVEAALCYARHVQGPKKLGKAKVPPTPTRDAASVRLLRLITLTLTLTPTLTLTRTRTRTPTRNPNPYPCPYPYPYP